LFINDSRGQGDHLRSDLLSPLEEVHVFPLCTTPPTSQDERTAHIPAPLFGRQAGTSPTGLPRGCHLCGRQQSKPLSVSSPLSQFLLSAATQPGSDGREITCSTLTFFPLRTLWRTCVSGVGAWTIRDTGSFRDRPLALHSLSVRLCPEQPRSPFGDNFRPSVRQFPPV